MIEISKNQIYKYILLVLLSFISSNKLYGQACYPNDPLAMNPGNLCLEKNVYHQHINNYPMTNGFAKDGYYGSAISPNIPGKKIEINKKNDGFFTNLKINNGNITIKTSTGKVFNFNTN